MQLRRRAHHVTPRMLACAVALTLLAALPAAQAVVRDGTGRSDRLTGTPTRDLLRGGYGNDVLRGLGGDDVLLGGSGNDTIVSVAGGRDVIDCGPGIDTLILGGDKRDTYKNCEKIK